MVGGLTLLQFKTYNKETVTEMWYQHNNKQIYQWKEIESTEINLYIMINLILIKVLRQFNEK